MIREAHRTERLTVSAVDGGEYGIELPTDFEGAYKVNAAHVHFYRPDGEEPIDSFELAFPDEPVVEVDGLVLPDDSYAGCEFEVAFLYRPGEGLPYEVVRTEHAELQSAEELDGRVAGVSASYDAEEMDRVDYVRIDVRDPESGEYVAGDVVRVGDANARDDEVLMGSTVGVFPGEYAGFDAEVAYLAA